MNRMPLLAIALEMAVLVVPTLAEAKQPNVVVVMTDDQGWGDLACNGNPWIKTPTMDALASESTLLTNYHVDPTCAPTRAALMTGRYSDRVGVWHTIQGRNLLRSREKTMADLFAANGYATGMFGKWHLGDVYPFRPEDRGFTHAVYHGGGGVMQAPDYWGNDYFDDTYIENGKRNRFPGFCTDVWFDEGMKFIKANKHKPFFAYIATNAPHSPLYCPTKYTDIYKEDPNVPSDEFYGMITNIDDNLAKLIQLLKDEGLHDDTILVFTTDNGTAAGLVKGLGYDGNMRGKKGSQYDGGHRVPFMIRWPNGNIEAGKEISRLTAHIDILPTFIDLCQLDAPEIKFDGSSLRELLYGDADGWPDRSLVVESQRVVDPVKWRQSAVMTDRWRLVDGKELYDIQVDPKQKHNIASEHPEVLQRLRNQYERFWSDVSAEHNLTSYMIIGSAQQPIVTLSSHDWLVERVPWNQPHIISGAMAKPAYWALQVEHAGEYEISLRRWPVEADKGINNGDYGNAFAFEQACLRIDDINETKPIPAGAKEVTFRVTLKKGMTRLAPTFVGGGIEATPYYVYVTDKIQPAWQTPEGMGIPVYDPEYGRRPPQTMSK
ncbi:Arylsulfatase precursor [Novipirellula galeiformis]|uniref:Arylsulfatase n=1 Tax=Novipirellula galeiformis TaxID=2528004 RepID=A0A5C6CF07_9BACT|nr:arylsulfatase [Novipirellula galeiformis]TWU22104.1 Arylsulfatase precursor [Novipirellula galeiformis]